MSNRIDEILKETGLINEPGPFPIKADLHQRIRKAMEQYGSECAAKATRLSFEATLPQIKRLKELVKEQKELIALYDEENLSDPAWLKESELRNKIKTLES